MAASLRRSMSMIDGHEGVPEDVGHVLLLLISRYGSFDDRRGRISISTIRFQEMGEGQDVDRVVPL